MVEDITGVGMYMAYLPKWFVRDNVCCQTEQYKTMITTSLFNCIITIVKSDYSGDGSGHLLTSFVNTFC